METEETGKSFSHTSTHLAGQRLGIGVLVLLLLEPIIEPPFPFGLASCCAQSCQLLRIADEWTQAGPRRLDVAATDVLG